MARSRRSRQTLAVLYVDLDDFKAVNDGHGHGAGDKLLIEVGQRLLHQGLDGFFIDDVVVFIGQAVLAVAGVGVERHIGHDAQLGKLFFQRSHHRGNQALRVPSLRAIRRFERLADHRKKRHYRNTQIHTLLRYWEQQI